MSREIVHSRTYAGTCVIRVFDERVASKTILTGNVQELVDWAEDYIATKIDCICSLEDRQNASYHIAFGMSPEFRYKTD